MLGTLLECFPSNSTLSQSNRERERGEITCYTYFDCHYIILSSAPLLLPPHQTYEMAIPGEEGHY